MPTPRQHQLTKGASTRCLENPSLAETSSTSGEDDFAAIAPKGNPGTSGEPRHVPGSHGSVRETTYTEKAKRAELAAEVVPATFMWLIVYILIVELCLYQCLPRGKTNQERNWNKSRRFKQKKILARRGTRWHMLAHFWLANQVKRNVLTILGTPWHALAHVWHNFFWHIKNGRTPDSLWGGRGRGFVSPGCTSDGSKKVSKSLTKIRH